MVYRASKKVKFLVQGFILVSSAVLGLYIFVYNRVSLSSREIALLTCLLFVPVLITTIFLNRNEVEIGDTYLRVIGAYRTRTIPLNTLATVRRVYSRDGDDTPGMQFITNDSIKLTVFLNAWSDQQIQDCISELKAKCPNVGWEDFPENFPKGRDH